MFGFLAFVLAVGGLLLWDRVRDLEYRQRQLERALDELRRAAPGSAAPSPPQPPPEAAAQPAARAEPTPLSPVPATPLPVWRPQPAQSSPAPRTPAEPAAGEPTIIDSVVNAVKGYFAGGNLVVRVGIIVLFFGVGFLLKYAAEHTQLSIEVRLIGVALGAVGLLVLGWVLRGRRRGFALALQGGAVGILYLTLFAALQLYALLPAEITFGLMAALGVGLCGLAIQQDSLALSMLGVTGGFLAPVLASTGQGNHVVLFSYYALLNAFVVAQAWFKAWRPLNLLAFLFTFGVGTVWGVLRYDPAQFATTEPFLLFFFVAFVAIAILFAFRRAPQLQHYVDGTLVFGNPVIAMGLQMLLVEPLRHGRAWSALGAGAFYLSLALWLQRTRRETLQLLKESFIALGIAFLTLAVPLWLDDTWTATTWALEGTAIMWMGLRQSRLLPLVAGILLQLAAAASYALRDGVPAAQPVVNAACMGALFIALAGLVSARVAAQPHALLERVGRWPSHLLLLWGLCWWLFAGVQEIDAFVPADWQAGAVLGLCALTAFLCAALMRRLSWPALAVPALTLLPAMLLAALAWRSTLPHPASDGGALAWPAAFAALWFSLYRAESVTRNTIREFLHGLALWLAALLAGWELSWQVSDFPNGAVWAAIAWGTPGTVLLAVLGSAFVMRLWPVRTHAVVFRGWIACGLALLLAGWLLWLQISQSEVGVRLYLPLLNPVDVASALAIAASALWLSRLWKAGETILNSDDQRAAIAALAGVVFVWLNAMLLRSLHLWTAVPWELHALAADTSVQAALSIFWTLLALGAMLMSSRSQWRVVWFCGAALMAVVVGKLFLVDLARVGTIARIVSFLVVGGLMLVIGYFSPLPPALKKPKDS